jgi:predicted metal-dependent peptidase
VRVEAAIAIDNSGSMSDEMIRDLLTEVKGMMDQFTDYKLRVWTFDTNVYNEQVFTPENINDIESYEVFGGGGTEFMCNWRYMLENDISPEKLIVMTDGYNNSPEWGIENYCDTVFLIHGNPQQNIVAPFGLTCYYTADEK